MEAKKNTIGNPRQLDYINIGLIIISMLIAILIPFQLFLFAYAVLGPLHYLTEINWLNGKKYFVNSNKLIGVFCVFALLFAFPYLFSLPLFENLAKNRAMDFIIQFFWQHINGLILIAIAISISLVFTKNRYLRGLIIAIALLIAYLFNTFNFYNIWIGIFIPTVIHVYLFTILFMIYGALKTKSTPGLIAAGFAIIAPLIILFIDVNPTNYLLSDELKNTFLATNFQVLIAKLSGFLGLSDGNQFYFYEKEYLKIQIFLAFAYTYHYLNWFSKTSLIGWYKNMSINRSLIIIFCWVLSVGLYAYDYETGFIILLALSLVHVFAEFPLNIVSIRGIYHEIKKS